MFTSVSHLISILLTIGSFLGLPYVPLSTTPPVHPVSVSVATSTHSVPIKTPSIPSKKTPPTTPIQKLPILVLQAPNFKFITPTVVTPSTSSSSPSAPIPAPITILPPSPAATTTPSPLPTPPITPSPIPPATALSLVQQSVVNIYCTSQSGNTITIVTGSGVVIDPRGVILTNAHVAAQILLRDYLNTPSNQCFIRSGSPAVASYHVDLIYISPTWIAEHGKEVSSPVQSEETGEGDYALLIATNALNYQALPAFSYLNPNLTQNFGSSINLLTAGYPAGGLTGQAVMKSLLQKTDTPTLKAQYSFHGNSVDLIGTSGTPIASRGSSGGAIANQNGELIGLITTTIPDGINPSLEDLQALTLSYINRDLQSKTNLDLKGFLNRDLTSVANSFKTVTEPALVNYLPH